MTRTVSTRDPAIASAGPPTLGHWSGEATDVHFGALSPDLVKGSVRRSATVVFHPTEQRVGLAFGGTVQWNPPPKGALGFPVLSTLGPLYPEWLGDRAFLETHGLRFPYMGGSMARGIATTDLVVALGQMGALGMFGAAGLPPAAVDAAIQRMASALDPLGLPWGCNLIHSPNEAGLENELVELFLQCGVRRVEASAFMRLTPAVVRYACSGLKQGPDGTVLRTNHLFAKISREEVARPFLSPAPKAILSRLVESGQLSPEEADLAQHVPLAQQIIVESDSGGHTDNRPLTALFPVIARLRDDLVREYGYQAPVHLGAAGGLGTPEALAAAYGLGAAFVVMGSVHQGALESGVSQDSRELLAQAGPADVAMTASADMFEMGVRVQVLTRGTMMAVRGNHLYDLYRRYPSLDAIPAEVRAKLEKDLFRKPLDEVWKETEHFFTQADPEQLERAEKDPKHKLALVCRWYVGNSSRWPINGELDRQADYQLWCGPAMGAFNRWVQGTFLEPAETRSVQQIALNLLEGAAVVTRAHQYRSYGLEVPGQAYHYTPEKLSA